MSGIAGIFNLDGRPVDPTDLQRMVATMARRGPDGAKTWSDGPIGLGHCMLWTTPESLHETLPRTNRAGTLAITADARIDNRPELISALALTDIPPADLSDSDLILAAYEKWGEACPIHLLGDFAFAIWDSRRRTLFCARDYFGVKPFYYYHTNSLFAFASEIKALLSLPEVPNRINEARIADYLVSQLEGIDKTSTFFQEIFRFPPAHRLNVSCQQVTRRAYWSLDSTQEIRYSSNDEYAQAFKEVFTEAVQCRLRSAGPVASMLSGGLDSSSIVVIARNLLSQQGSGRLHTFSAIAKNGTHCAETQSIKAIVNMGGLEAHTIQPEQLDTIMADVEFMLQYTDDLFDTDLLSIPFVMYSAARTHGLRVLLDGVPGDNVVSLDDKCLAYHWRAGRWQTVVTEAYGFSKLYEVSPASLIWANFKLAFVPNAVRKFKRACYQNDTLDHVIGDTIINPDFAQAVDLRQRLEALHKHGWTTLHRTIEQDHTNNLDHPYITVALERYGRVAAALSIEPRHPFMDRRLVEFCVALPWEQKIYNGWTKTVLRRAMAGRLPEVVRWRRDKLNLAGEFWQAWLVLTQPWLKNLISNQLKDLNWYINSDAVQRAFQRFQTQGRLDDGHKVLQAAILAIWLRRHNFHPASMDVV